MYDFHFKIKTEAEEDEREWVTIQVQDDSQKGKQNG
jgi:hypothetical protein